MRHFLRSKGVQRRSGPITLLTLGVGVTATQTGLIAASGRTDRASESLTRASRAAALAAVAAAANQYGGAAASAQIASSGEVHWSPWPMGKDSDARFVTYFACSVASSQLWARHRSWLGGWSRCHARVSTGRSDIYRISGADATPTQAFQNTYSHVERRHWPRSRLTVRCPFLPRFACQTKDCDAIPPPGALRAANRRTI